MKIRRVPTGAARSLWLKSQFESPESERRYSAELVRERVVEAIEEACEVAGINRAEIARRLGKSRGAITRMLGQKNLTLRTVGELLWACGLELTDVEVDAFGSTIVAASPESEVGFDVIASSGEEPVEAVGEATPRFSLSFITASAGSTSASADAK